MLYERLAIGLAVFATGVASGWKVQTWRIGRLQAEAVAALATERAAAARAAADAEAAHRATEARWVADARRIEDAYKTKAAQLGRSAADMRSERDRLLDAIAAGGCTTSEATNAPTGVDGAAALRLVAAECAGTVAQVAEAADACAARLSGLQEWVKQGYRDE